MNTKNSDWNIDNTATELILTHSESGRVFRFLKTEDFPYLSATPTVKFNDLAKVTPESQINEAYNAAIKNLSYLPKTT